MPLGTSASGFRLVRVALSYAALSLLLLAGALPAVASTGSGRTGSVRSRAGHRHQERPGAHHGRLYQGSLAKAAIIGGVEPDPGTFPFLAYIVDKRGEEVSFCTGTVLSVNVILTAGHCAEDTETGLINEPSGYAIVTGNVEWTSSARQVTGVSKVIVYPEYSRSQATADAALLVLSAPITAPSISLATWPSDSPALEAGKLALLAGWGKTYYEQETLTERLRWAETVMQKPSYCETHAPTFYPSQELCVIYPPNYETGACLGDSGGPLISLNPAGSGVIQTGVIGHIYGECLTARPTVVTRADLIASWAHEWIEAVKPAPPPPPPPPPPAPTPTPTPAPAPAPVVQAAPPWVPANTPGLYLTPRSRQGRRVAVHVSGDGQNVVGLGVKTSVPCQHGYIYELETSWLSYSDYAPIASHVVATTLETERSGYMRAGSVGLYLLFSSTGTLEGRLHIHIRSKNRHAGLCSGTLSFKAKV
jgi:hypothetical protein